MPSLNSVWRIGLDLPRLHVQEHEIGRAGCKGHEHQDPPLLEPGAGGLEAGPFDETLDLTRAIRPLHPQIRHAAATVGREDDRRTVGRPEGKEVVLFVERQACRHVPLEIRESRCRRYCSRRRPSRRAFFHRARGSDCGRPAPSRRGPPGGHPGGAASAGPGARTAPLPPCRSSCRRERRPGAHHRGCRRNAHPRAPERAVDQALPSRGRRAPRRASPRVRRPGVRWRGGARRSLPGRISVRSPVAMSTISMLAPSKSWLAGWTVISSLSPDGSTCGNRCDRSIGSSERNVNCSGSPPPSGTLPDSVADVRRVVDVAVRPPGGATVGPDALGQRQRRAAADRDLLQRALGVETDPLAVP